MEGFIKLKKQVWKIKNDIRNKKKLVFHAHFKFHSRSSSCLEKWKETSSTTGILLIQTSSYYYAPENFRFTSNDSHVSQAERKWGVNSGSLFIQYSITAQHNGRNDCEVTTLVATEHVRRKHLLLESFTLYCSSTFLIYWRRQFDSISAH